MSKFSSTLLIDVGNSSLKWSFLKDHAFTEQQSCLYFEHTPIQQFKDILKKNSDVCDTVLVVSVQGDEFNRTARRIANENDWSFQQVKSIESLSGIINAYDEPHKLGADRFVAMVAAHHLSKRNQKACIIIDSGTATTIDAVDSRGNHLGGLILPGIDLCSNSLLQSTKQLPLWGQKQQRNSDKRNNQNDFKLGLFSSNTIDAINSASIFGLSGAIENICLKMEKKIKHKENNIDVNRFFCGGSAELLLPYLDSDFQLHKDLIMQGLQIISESDYDEHQ